MLALPASPIAARLAELVHILIHKVAHRNWVQAKVVRATFMSGSNACHRIPYGAMERALFCLLPWVQCAAKRVLLALVLALAGNTVHAVELVVSAASSLSDAFRSVVQGYEARHPYVRLRLNFGGSGSLLRQLAQGAPVDVLAMADQETMDAASAQGLVLATSRRNFAGNALALVAPAYSKLVVPRLEALVQPGVQRFAIGNVESVPAGRYARQALDAARLWPQLQSRAILVQNVRQALDYVARGEVDAGFVYATDALLAKGKVRVLLQLAPATPITYPVAVAAGSAHTAEARRFVEYLLEPDAQAVLASYGFRKP